MNEVVITPEQLQTLADRVLLAAEAYRDRLAALHDLEDRFGGNPRRAMDPVLNRARMDVSRASEQLVRSVTERRRVLALIRNHR